MARGGLFIYFFWGVSIYVGGSLFSPIRRPLGVNQASEILALLLSSSSLDLPNLTTGGVGVWWESRLQDLLTSGGSLLATFFEDKFQAKPEITAKNAGPEHFGSFFDQKSSQLCYFLTIWRAIFPGCVFLLGKN